MEIIEDNIEIEIRVDDFSVKFSSLVEEGEDGDRNRTRFCEIYKEYGVVVIEDVFKEEECNRLMEDIISSFEGLGTGINRNDPKTWGGYNAPPQTRPGLFQALMSHLPSIWDTRTDPRVYLPFSILYNNLREEEDIPLIPSIDGINVKCNSTPLFDINKSKDWPHLDQTERKREDVEFGSRDDNTFKCLQGQLVLTQTTASFRCSPRSHKVFNTVLDLAGIKMEDKSNWCKFNIEDEELINRIKDVVINQAKGVYQMPIYVNKGSFIIWSSSLIHSAKLSDRIEDPSPDPFLGWRGVLYISYRPREEFTPSQINKIKKYILENRVMNHWNTHVFSKLPGGRYQSSIKRAPTLIKIIQDPTLVFTTLNIDPQQNLDLFNRFL